MLLLLIWRFRLDKKNKDLNEFVNSQEYKIDWFGMFTPERAREVLDNLDQYYESFEKKYGWKLSDKAKKIIVARLSEIAGRNNELNLKLNVDPMPKSLEQQRVEAWRMFTHHSLNASYWFEVVKELDEKIMKQGRTNNEPDSER